MKRAATCPLSLVSADPVPQWDREAGWTFLARSRVRRRLRGGALGGALGGWVGGLGGGARIGVCSASKRRHAVLVGLRTSSRGVEKNRNSKFPSVEEHEGVPRGVDEAKKRLEGSGTAAGLAQRQRGFRRVRLRWVRVLRTGGRPREGARRQRRGSGGAAAQQRRGKL